MLPFRKILFPVDYSAACQSIVPHVRDAVRHFGAQLTLVYAHVPLPMWYGDYAIASIAEPAEVRADEEEQLRRFAAAWFPNTPVDTIVQVGEPGTVIDEVVRRQGADLVMMPTHGHGPLRKLLLGSVTAKVLHDVSCAVWTGASGLWEEHRPAVQYRSVLCALDQSEEAVAVLRAAAAIAKSYNAQLHLFHAAQTPPPSGELDVFTYSKEIVESANTWLRELKAGEGIDAPHAVADRAVGPGVREEALRRKADLIVVGRGNAQGAVSRLWSNLYAVVREAPCPVLSI